MNTGAFQEITIEYPELTIDLFATRLNHKFDTYCAWQPDPGCSFVDAFSQNWHPFHFYAFPPFSLIPRCLQKINKEKATGILTVLLWPSQPWFPFLIQHLYKTPWILNPVKNLLQHLGHQKPHHLWRKLKLMVCPVSGIPSQTTIFLDTLPTSSWHPGALAPKNSTIPPLNSGSSFVVRGELIAIPHKWVKL